MNAKSLPGQALEEPASAGSGLVGGVTVGSFWEGCGGEVELDALGAATLGGFSVMISRACSDPFVSSARTLNEPSSGAVHVAGAERSRAQHRDSGGRGAEMGVAGARSGHARDTEEAAGLERRQP